MQSHSSNLVSSFALPKKAGVSMSADADVPPQDNGPDKPFYVGDVKIHHKDLTGRSIEEIYIKVRPKYAVYKTAGRVVVQYADAEKLAIDQQQNMSVMNLARAQIDALISDWNQSKYAFFKRKSAKYDGRVASALILCLQDDS